MSARPLLLALVVAIGCGDNTGPDFEGTYPVQITGTLDAPFPPLRWPGSMVIGLALDDLGEPRLTLSGAPPTAQEVKRSAAALDMRTTGTIPLSLVDPHDCDFPLSWTGDRVGIMNYHFENDRLTGHTSGIAYCQRHPGTDPDTFLATLDFTFVGERSPDAR